MSAFAARANAVLPPALAARFGFQKGHATSPATCPPRLFPRVSATAVRGLRVPDGVKFPIMADESVMSPKAHGTTETPVQQNLRWNCEWKTADKICSFNRHYAEYAGYWESTSFLDEVDREGETTYYDSVSGKPLFIAPRGRSFEDFVKESKSHGWPSFRDEEVVWENVRCLKDGEAISLGHPPWAQPSRQGGEPVLHQPRVRRGPTHVTMDERRDACLFGAQVAACNARQDLRELPGGQSCPQNFSSRLPLSPA